DYIDWARQSQTPSFPSDPDIAQGIAAMIARRARQFPQDQPVDVHLIGHSLGAVVNSVALQDLQRYEAQLPQLGAGFVQLTMLDPHPAHNAHIEQLYSVPPNIVGW